MKDRQLMFFSASINKETLNLAKTLVKDVEIIKIENKSEINPKIEHICILGSLRDRFENLRKLLAAEQPQRAIVFVNNNTDLRQINEKLQYHKVKSTAIYGNASKEERQRALDAFSYDELKDIIDKIHFKAFGKTIDERRKSEGRDSSLNKKLLEIPTYIREKISLDKK